MHNLCIYSALSREEIASAADFTVLGWGAPLGLEPLLFARSLRIQFNRHFFDAAGHGDCPT